MIIEKNPIELEALEAFKRGDAEEARRLEAEFVRQFREAFEKGGHCSCQEPCRWHGMCRECVAIHRAHQDHLPNCFEDIKKNAWNRESEEEQA